MNDREMKDAAVEALMRTGGNVQDAAALMGIPLRTFYRSLHRWGLMGQAAAGRHAADATRVPVAGRNADTVAREKGVTRVPQVADRPTITLDSIRAESRLASNEMGTETIHTPAPVGRPRSIEQALRKFFGEDRWNNFEQVAIDHAGQTREFTTPEKIIILAVDLGLPEIMRAVAAAGLASVGEHKPRPGKDHK